MTTTTLKSTQGSQSLQLGSVSGLWVNCRPSGLHLLQSVKSLAISFIQRVLVGAPSLAGAQEATLQPFRRNNQGIGMVRTSGGALPQLRLIKFSQNGSMFKLC